MFSAAGAGEAGRFAETRINYNYSPPLPTTPTNVYPAHTQQTHTQQNDHLQYQPPVPASDSHSSSMQNYIQEEVPVPQNAPRTRYVSHAQRRFQQQQGQQGQDFDPSTTTLVRRPTLPNSEVAEHHSAFRQRLQAGHIRNSYKVSEFNASPEIQSARESLQNLRSLKNSNVPGANTAFAQAEADLKKATEAVANTDKFLTTAYAGQQEGTILGSFIKQVRQESTVDMPVNKGRKVLSSMWSSTRDATKTLAAKTNISDKNWTTDQALDDQLAKAIAGAPEGASSAARTAYLTSQRDKSIDSSRINSEIKFTAHSLMQALNAKVSGVITPSSLLDLNEKLEALRSLASERLVAKREGEVNTVTGKVVDVVRDSHNMLGAGIGALQQVRHGQVLPIMDEVGETLNGLEDLIEENQREDEQMAEQLRQSQQQQQRQQALEENTASNSTVISRRQIGGDRSITAPVPQQFQPSTISTSTRRRVSEQDRTLSGSYPHRSSLERTERPLLEVRTNYSVDDRPQYNLSSASTRRPVPPRIPNPEYGMGSVGDRPLPRQYEAYNPSLGLGGNYNAATLGRSRSEFEPGAPSSPTETVLAEDQATERSPVAENPLNPFNDRPTTSGSDGSDTRNTVIIGADAELSPLIPPPGSHAQTTDFPFPEATILSGQAPGAGTNTSAAAAVNTPASALTSSPVNTNTTGV